jgi:aryl-alcohol dehydrogenase-like predicted oxidoreductase
MDIIGKIMEYGVSNRFSFEDCVKAVDKFNDDPDFWMNQPIKNLFWNN